MRYLLSGEWEFTAALNVDCTYLLTYLHTYIHTHIHTHIFVVVNFDALAQASEFRIERRQVVFLWWMQDWNPEGLWNPVSSRRNSCWQTDWAIEDQAKAWTRQPVPMISKHSAHLTPLPFGIRTWLWRYTYLLWLQSLCFTLYEMQKSIVATIATPFQRELNQSNWIWARVVDRQSRPMMPSNKNNYSRWTVATNSVITLNIVRTTWLSLIYFLQVTITLSRLSPKLIQALCLVQCRFHTSHKEWHSKSHFLSSTNILCKGSVDKWVAHQYCVRFLNIWIPLSIVKFNV